MASFLKKPSTYAVVISVVLHVALFMALFGPPSGLSNIPSVFLVAQHSLTARHSEKYTPPGGVRARTPLESSKESSVPTNTAAAAPPTSGENTEDNGGVIDGSQIGIRASYPRLSRVLHESGRVVIEIQDLRAHPRARVLSSSGYERLDNSALNAIQEALKLGRLEVDRSNASAVQKISFLFKLTP
ncbi:MAG: hypothetical protein ABIR96_06380 [Bdellovibrionota bacterium]